MVGFLFIKRRGISPSLHLWVNFLFNLCCSLFVRISGYCNQYGGSIPITFALGFFTSFMVSRFWDQYQTIPWPDSLSYLVSAYVRGGTASQGQLLRRTIMRYVNLSIVIVLTAISPRARLRFPELEDLVNAG